MIYIAGYCSEEWTKGTKGTKGTSLLSTHEVIYEEANRRKNEDPFESTFS